MSFDGIAVAQLIATAGEVDGGKLTIAGMEFRRESGRWWISVRDETALVVDPVWLAALDRRVTK